MADADNTLSEQSLRDLLRACSDSIDEWIKERGVQGAQERLLEVINASLTPKTDASATPLAEEDVIEVGSAATAEGGCYPCATCLDYYNRHIYTYQQYVACMNCPCTS